MTVIIPQNRYTKFIEYYTETGGNVYQSAIKAGFAKSTALKRGKRILETAMKKQDMALKSLRNDKDLTKDEKKEIRQTIGERIGLSRKELFDNAKWLAEQERDLGVRFKVVSALLRDEGVDLGTEEQTKVTVPVLNISVKEKAPLSRAIEYTTPILEADNIDCATLENEEDTGVAVQPDDSTS